MTSLPATTDDAPVEGSLRTFADGLPVEDDAVRAELRENLRSLDEGTRADAALRLGAGFLRSHRRIGERLLRQACAGPPLTAARAMLRLAYAEFDSGTANDNASVVGLLDVARERTQGVWFANHEVDEALLRVRIDLASALAIAGKRMDAVDMLLAADAALRKTLGQSPPPDGRTRDLQQLLGLVNLRLGQVQMTTDYDSADAAFRVAAKHGVAVGRSDGRVGARPDARTARGKRARH